MTEPRGGDDDGQSVGSLAEEVAKLVEALRGLPGQRISGADGLVDGAGRLWEDLNRHLADDGNCRYCPLCQVIGLVRQPEVRGHLVSAGRSLAAALASALATQAPADRRPPPGSPDLGDDGVV